MVTNLPPMPKAAHELSEDPVLGKASRAVNAVTCDLLMVQVSEANRTSWLRRMVSDAEALAAAARELLRQEGH